MFKIPNPFLELARRRSLIVAWTPAFPLWYERGVEIMAQ